MVRVEREANEKNDEAYEMSASRSSSSGGGGSQRRESAADALARARAHAQAAAAESMRAIGALLDAASIASSGEPAEANAALAPAVRMLENLSSQLGGNDLESAHMLESIAKALDTEITRWEERARNDPDARSVLRAFLGLRELLWEFGIRADVGEVTQSGRPKKKPARSRRKKVQHVAVEG